MSNRFYYGVSYSPLVFPEADWHRDLAGMQGAGMNLLRLGDVHGSWDLIEPEPGVYKLEKLDRFYRLAAEYGIEILISTGASGPPLWLAQKYPDVTPLNSRGERYPLGASYHWACIAHPAYREALSRYIARLISFTAEHHNHFGWQISNEIGFPFLPARGEDHLGLYCYCPNCRERFQEWVKHKYTDLEALTEAWAWGTSYYVYQDWSQVFPPESMPSAWASVTRWLDWRLFWQAAFTNFARWQHLMLKKGDPGHPTSVNTFNFKGYDRFGVFTGLDQWQLAQAVDHIGYDLYPGSGNKLATRPEHISMFLDHGRSVAQTGGRDFWLHEVESGPIGGWVMGPEHRTTAEDLQTYCVEALGHDAKLMLFMPWREWHYQPLRWGALVDLDGEPTPRLASAADMGAFLKQYGEEITTAHVPAARVALLESKKNAIFFRGVDQEEALFAAQRGAYRAAWELGFAVDFVSPAQINQGHLPYREILLPMMGLVERDTAQSLANFVREGGVLVGFARCATLDERGWSYSHAPGDPLAQVFGLASVEPDLLVSDQIVFEGKPYQGHWNRDLVTVNPGTEILAKFTDGRPAVTLKRYGDGYGVYIATQADAGHLVHSPSLLQTVLKVVNARIALEPRVQIIEPQVPNRVIDPHLLDAPQHTFLLITNGSDETHNLHLVLNDDRRAERVTLIYPAAEPQQPLEWSQADGQLSIIVLSHLPKEVMIIKIDWK
ncbi:MAG: beta-galactosidase [Brevefilum sp.]|nr:beta-galactosidase [Brevefilum sp.]